MEHFIYEFFFFSVKNFLFFWSCVKDHKTKYSMSNKAQIYQQISFKYLLSPWCSTNVHLLFDDFIQVKLDSTCLSQPMEFLQRASSSRDRFSVWRFGARLRCWRSRSRGRRCRPPDAGSGPDEAWQCRNRDWRWSPAFCGKKKCHFYKPKWLCS